jgi:hypothetical protein
MMIKVIFHIGGYGTKCDVCESAQLLAKFTTYREQGIAVRASHRNTLPQYSLSTGADMPPANAQRIKTKRRLKSRKFPSSLPMPNLGKNRSRSFLQRLASGVASPSCLPPPAVNNFLLIRFYSGVVLTEGLGRDEQDMERLA